MKRTNSGLKPATTTTKAISPPTESLSPQPNYKVAKFSIKNSNAPSKIPLRQIQSVKWKNPENIFAAKKSLSTLREEILVVRNPPTSTNISSIHEGSTDFVNPEDLEVSTSLRNKTCGSSTLNQHQQQNLDGDSTSKTPQQHHHQQQQEDVVEEEEADTGTRKISEYFKPLNNTPSCSTKNLKPSVFQSFQNETPKRDSALINSTTATSSTTTTTDYARVIGAPIHQSTPALTRRNSGLTKSLREDSMLSSCSGGPPNISSIFSPIQPNTYLADVDGTKIEKLFSVLYSKASTRKHKRWENDGFLHYNYGAKELRLLKPNGREPNFKAQIFKSMGTRLEARVEEEFVAGHQFQMAGYDLEIQEELNGGGAKEQGDGVEYDQQNLQLVVNSPPKMIRNKENNQPGGFVQLNREIVENWEYEDEDDEVSNKPTKGRFNSRNNNNNNRRPPSKKDEEALNMPKPAKLNKSSTLKEFNESFNG